MNKEANEALIALLDRLHKGTLLACQLSDAVGFAKVKNQAAAAKHQLANALDNAQTLSLGGAPADVAKAAVDKFLQEQSGEIPEEPVA